MLYVAARNITRPLSDLARAADSVGRDAAPVPQLAERGARELRDAARAFNTMQDRLHRYLDSRTRVLAAMSHDLKTPLTRLRLQVETLDNPPMQARIGRELDEMESMVREALALFRGLDDGEPAAPHRHRRAAGADPRASSPTWARTVTITGRALQPFVGKPQALKRCLTNLHRQRRQVRHARRHPVEDGAELVIRVRDSRAGHSGGGARAGVRAVLPARVLAQPRQRRHADWACRSRATSPSRTAARSRLANLPGGGLEATAAAAATALTDTPGRSLHALRRSSRALSHSLTIVHGRACHATR